MRSQGVHVLLFNTGEGEVADVKIHCLISFLQRSCTSAL
jgi:hypothetical protein